MHMGSGIVCTTKSFLGNLTYFCHGHEGCKYFVVPKTRTEWWLDKINNTKERDYNKAVQIKKLGWRILVIWECELRSEADTVLHKLIKDIKL